LNAEGDARLIETRLRVVLFPMTTALTNAPAVEHEQLGAGDLGAGA
jgi:hypothetical protein